MSVELVLRPGQMHQTQQFFDRRGRYKEHTNAMSQVLLSDLPMNPYNDGGKQALSRNTAEQ